MANVLGLSFYFHDSAAALVCDGKIKAAVAEERLCRRKHTNEFPKLAIEYCLEAGGIGSVNDIDAIVFYEKPVQKLYRVVEGLVSSWPRGFNTFLKKLPTFLSTKVNIHEQISERLPGYRGEILFSEHHLSHAASAFYCSPFEEAAIITIDGVGESETTAIGFGGGQNINLEYTIKFPHSIGLLYSALTGYLGFKVNDGEWKVMGLAPYGQPKYVEQFKKLVTMKSDGSFHLNLKYFAHHYSSKETANINMWEQLFGIPRRLPKDSIEQHHEDLALSGQLVVEEMILNIARFARSRYGVDSLVLAGGVGLNSVANWRIQKEGIFKHVWIQPAAGDDGGALGAALLASKAVYGDPRCSEMKDAYLGPSFTNEDIHEFLQSHNISFVLLSEENLLVCTADFLDQGKVIGWFQGRMEFGPRSLGNRSILANPTKENIKAVVNEKIKFREYFRPFAPSIPLEHVHEYFEVESNESMAFMLKVPKVRPEKRHLIPGVTHKDGTGRVQTVTQEANERFYNLLNLVKERIGVPILLNTSFNVRGEPIVCTPKDAYLCFMNTGIDALVLGDYLITQKRQQQIDYEQGYRRSDALEYGGLKEEDEDLTTASILFNPSDHKGSDDESTTEKVLHFYRQLPFNYYSNSLDAAVELMKKNQVKSYPYLHKYLSDMKSGNIMDLGCGAGWFTNSIATHYNLNVVGVDINPVVLKQARAVSRMLPNIERTSFKQANIFEFDPHASFDVVNSLGVLHHTYDCHAAIRRCLSWVKEGGYVHLGLYHHYGRKPFLDYFKKLQNDGASGSNLYEAFAKLNPDITDPTHMMSWFRDQVLHPHETQHTYEEIYPILESCGFEIKKTNINHFKDIRHHNLIINLEKKMEQISVDALERRKRYYPGFFTIWAEKTRS